jgi:hypothetical protein
VGLKDFAIVARNERTNDRAITVSTDAPNVQSRVAVESEKRDDLLGSAEVADDITAERTDAVQSVQLWLQQDCSHALAVTHSGGYP